MQKVMEGDLVEIRFRRYLSSRELVDESDCSVIVRAGAKGDSVFTESLGTAITGMNLFETKIFKVPVKLAYGHRRHDKVHKLPIDGYRAHQVGDPIQLKITGSDTATIESGHIVAIDSREATVDTNHPLAGRDLLVEVSVDRITP